MENTMPHIYWTARCKTEKCPVLQVAKYIGDYDDRKVFVLPDVMPGWFDFQCAECGKIHRYYRMELSPFALPHPPTPEWREWW